MQLIIESAAETQKTSLAAVADFTDNYLLIVERMAQLHIEVSRTAFEQSAELALLCLQFAAEIWLVATGRELPFGLSAEDKL